MVAPTAIGPLDELIALHDEVGAFAAVEALDTVRCRAGLPEGLLLRTVAVVPFLGTRRGARRNPCRAIPIRCAMRWRGSRSAPG